MSELTAQTNLSESDEVAVGTILTFLSAYSSAIVRAALKRKNLSERDGRTEGGWMLWTGEGTPPKPFEYTVFNGKWYYREPLAPEQVVKQVAARRAPSGKSTTDATQTAKICPYCGAEAFAQSVCPKCAKGKAGIRKQYICGEVDSHVFYTE